MDISPKSNYLFLIIVGALSLLLLGGAAGFYLAKGQMNLPPPSVVPPSGLPQIPDGTACPADAKICPDGSTVGRIGPNCEFAPCPGNNLTPTASVYKCPETDWVDCKSAPNMLGLRFECTEEYLNWARTNCPGFKGATY